MRTIVTSCVAAIAATLLVIAPASASVIGVAVDPTDNSTVGETEFRAALGGDAIRYFIPLEDDDGIYGVDDGGNFGLTADSGDGGGTLSIYVLFEPINAGAEFFLSILFEDLDLIGANDPVGFLEAVEILSADGATSLSGGVITDIGGLVTGDSGTQQLLSLFLGVIADTAFLVRLDFTAQFDIIGTNTPEYLIASLSEVPLPAALPLFLAGIAGLGFAGRNKKKRAAA